MVAMFVINFGDQFVLRHYRSLAEVGIYALAYRIGMVVALIYASFHAYWSAQVYKILRQDDASVIFARLLTYVALMISFVTLLLTLSSKPALRILVTPEFQAAAVLIPILAAANGIRSIGEFLACRFLAAGHPAYKACSDWVGLAICVTLYFVLIPRYGMWGGAFATIGTFMAMTSIVITATYLLNPYRVEGMRLLKLVLVTAGILILYYAVTVSSLPLQIGWSVLLIALFPAGLWITRFFTPKEWLLLSSAREALGLWRHDSASPAGVSTNSSIELFTTDPKEDSCGN